MSAEKRKISYIKVAAGSLADCWRAHPPLFLGLMAVSALLCAVEVGEIFAMRHLFDAAAEYIGGRIATSEAISAAVPMAVILAAGPFVNILEYLGQGYFWRRGSGYLMARYHERIQRIPLLEFEKPETFDRMKKAQLGSEDAPSASRSLIQFAFHFLPYSIFTAVFLVSVRPALVAALFVIFASVLLAQILRSGLIRRFEEENAGLRRRTEYLEGCITSGEYAKETRTFGAVGYFFGLFADSLKRFNAASMKSERKIAGVELLLRSVNVLGYAGILALLVYYVAEGTVSVGAFASVFYSVERMGGVLATMVEYIGDLLKEFGMAAFTREFLDAKKEKGDQGPLDKRADIRLEHISFAYPGGGSVLEGIDLVIRGGETLAIVGENGAGKTTLTKIITGLYGPTSGTVRCGGRDISGYVKRARFGRVSGVFQNFVRYKLTARENIEISDVGASNDAKRAAKEAGAGAQLSKLPDGFDTVLSREFDGTELSGGEWQRVAIARGLYRECDLIVLDEPTAAIDPIEESNIFRLFKQSAKGKTAILVTHRLGSTKIADRILLLENGRVCELGTHAQLMEKDGKYAKMYREQASWYER